MSKSFVGNRHAHGCRRCHLRYQDACVEPQTDGLCTACRGGRPWQLLIDNAAPRDCCAAARPATKDETKEYRLAGAHRWLICPACKRTHPQASPTGGRA